MNKIAPTLAAFLFYSLLCFSHASYAQELSSLAPSQTAEIAFFSSLAQTAKTYTRSSIRYDPSYFKLAYPNGDAPADKGVCTDLVIRSYRALGVDLQKLVHEDMKKNFSKYPKIWRLSRPDPNIDQRRVPNLMTFFRRQGAVLPVSSDPKDYAPGDLVTWDLGGGVAHIGVVTGEIDPSSGRYRIAHHIGGTPGLEDVLFAWKITGHFRFHATSDASP